MVSIHLNKLTAQTLQNTRNEQYSYSINHNQYWWNCSKLIISPQLKNNPKLVNRPKLMNFKTNKRLNIDLSPYKMSKTDQYREQTHSQEAMNCLKQKDKNWTNYCKNLTISPKLKNSSELINSLKLMNRKQQNGSILIRILNRLTAQNGPMKCPKQTKYLYSRKTKLTNGPKLKNRPKFANGLIYWQAIQIWHDALNWKIA